MSDDDLARRKEREQNEIPKGPRWLWDWKVWAGALALGVALVVANYINGFH